MRVFVAAAAVAVAVLLGGLIMYLSPRDPRKPEVEQGTIRTGVTTDRPTGWAKWCEIAGWAAGGQSLSYRRPVGRLVAEALAVSLPLNVLGLGAGWALGLALGNWAGARLGRASGRAAVGAALLLVVLPSPVQVEVARTLFVEAGAGNRTILPGALTLCLLTFPALAVNQAVLVAGARARPEVVFARSLGLPAAAVRDRVRPHTAAFWRAQFALLLVGLVEGPVLVESAFDLHGTGQLALSAFRRADAAVVVPLVGLSATAVTAGWLLATSRTPRT